MSSDRESRTLEEHHPGALLARITGARKGTLYDGLFDDGTCATLLALIQEERTVPTISASRRSARRRTRSSRSRARHPTKAIRRWSSAGG
jgi:hypothetical protein